MFVVGEADGLAKHRLLPLPLQIPLLLGLALTQILTHFEHLLVFFLGDFELAVAHIFQLLLFLAFELDSGLLILLENEIFLDFYFLIQFEPPLHENRALAGTHLYSLETRYLLVVFLVISLPNFKDFILFLASNFYFFVSFLHFVFEEAHPVTE